MKKKEKILVIDFTAAVNYRCYQILSLAITQVKPRIIFLSVDSGGGEAAASFEIYNLLKDYRSKGGKVISYVRDQANSGMLAIVSASDKIIANPVACVGGIGVIWDIKKDDGEYYTLKIGKYKDMFTGKRLTKMEKKIILANLRHTYDVFCEIISEGRKIPLAQIKKIADGKIFNSNEALKLKLIDKIAYLPEAEKETANLLKNPKNANYSYVKIEDPPKQNDEEE
jgi:protease-4